VSFTDPSSPRAAATARAGTSSGANVSDFTASVLRLGRGSSIGSSSSFRMIAEKGEAFEQPWLEKYRPRVMEDVVGNEDTVGRLQVLAQQGNMPNLILSGPPGTGKTTSVLALARTMLGDAFKEAVLELNASDDRGIEVVRGRIKAFAQKKVTLPPGKHKIIILDEADSMTEGAQQAMRRTMELFSATTRFALACNLSEKIIEPIQSRCAVLRYSKLTDAQVLKRLHEVLAAEQAPFNEQGLEALIFTAEGDMRQALNNAQATIAGFGFISTENVFKVCDQPHPLLVRQCLQAAALADYEEANSVVEELWNRGFCGLDIVGTLFRVAKNEPLNEELKLEFIKEIGFCHMRVLDGLDTLLQISGLVAKLCCCAAMRGIKPPAKKRVAA
jgi:replication factor C subunit 2/4